MAQHEIYESQKPHHFLALKECQKRKWLISVNIFKIYWIPLPPE
jgi:hypothetical protein